MGFIPKEVNDMKEIRKIKKGSTVRKAKEAKKPYTKPVLTTEEVFEKNALYTNCNPNQTPEDGCPAGF